MAPAKKPGKAANRKHKTTASLKCALLYPSERVVVGGEGVGFPDNIRTDLTIYASQTGLMYPHLALVFRFPRAEDDAASYHSSFGLGASSDRQVLLRFDLNLITVTAEPLDGEVHTALFGTAPGETTMGVLRVAMRDSGRVPQVCGLGLPFVGKDGVNCIDDNLPIMSYPDKRQRTIVDILNQSESHILVQDIKYLDRFGDEFPKNMVDLDSRTAKYPYGFEHRWGIDRYKRESTEYSGPHFPAMPRHESVNDALTVYTRSVAQDVMPLVTDIEALAKVDIGVRFVHAGELDDDGRTAKFYAIFRISSEVRRFHPTALTRAVKQGSVVTIIFPDKENPTGGSFKQELTKEF